MPIEAFLAGLVVIRRDHQHRVGARLLRVLGERNRLGGRVGAGARDHRHAALGLLHAPLDHAVVLFMGERRALARGADRHQPVGALGDLPIHQLAERALVESAVLERRHQRGE